jgi:PAS domain S-box-containing protein
MAMKGERKKEKEFPESLFRNLPVETTLLTKKGVRIDANPAFCRFFEKTREECINAPMEELYVKEDIPKLENALEKCKRTGSGSCEARMLRGDGAIRNYTIRFAALKDREGNIINIIGTGIDITELRKREEELERTRDFARSVFSDSPTPSSLQTLEGVRTDINEAAIRLYKRGRENWLGAKSEEMYDAEDVDKVRKLVEDCKKTGFSRGEITAIKGDGSKFPVILEFSALKDRKGSITNLICTATDITELRKRELNLKSAVSHFASVLSEGSKGDLTQRANLSKLSKEYKPIGEDINSMITSFQGMMKTIRSASEEVTDKAERMAMASEETGSAIEEITESMKEVAEEAVKQSDTAMKQASAAEETECALEEQSKSSEELSTIGQEMLQLSGELSDRLKAFKIEKAKRKVKRG